MYCFLFLNKKNFNTDITDMVDWTLKLNCLFQYPVSFTVFFFKNFMPFLFLSSVHVVAKLCVVDCCDVYNHQ